MTDDFELDRERRAEEQRRPDRRLIEAVESRRSVGEEFARTGETPVVDLPPPAIRRADANVGRTRRHGRARPHPGRSRSARDSSPRASGRGCCRCSPASFAVVALYFLVLAVAGVVDRPIGRGAGRRCDRRDGRRAVRRPAVAAARSAARSRRRALAGGHRPARSSSPAATGPATGSPRPRRRRLPRRSAGSPSRRSCRRTRARRRTSRSRASPRCSRHVDSTRC